MFKEPDCFHENPLSGKQAEEPLKDRDKIFANHFHVLSFCKVKPNSVVEVITTLLNGIMHFDGLVNPQAVAVANRKDQFIG